MGAWRQIHNYETKKQKVTLSFDENYHIYTVMD